MQTSPETYMSMIMLAGKCGGVLTLVFLVWLFAIVTGIGHHGLTERSVWYLYRDGESRGVVVIAEEMQDHPDYHPPDKQYKYIQEK